MDIEARWPESIMHVMLCYVMLLLRLKHFFKVNSGAVKNRSGARCFLSHASLGLDNIHDISTFLYVRV